MNKYEHTCQWCDGKFSTRFPLRNQYGEFCSLRCLNLHLVEAEKDNQAVVMAHHESEERHYD
jgi:endogenous inhibitor of DNA gyrase (YacG/DUF329 family)